MFEASNIFDQKEWIELISKYIGLGLQLDMEDNSDIVTYKMYVSVPEHSCITTDDGTEVSGEFMVHEFKRDIYKWMGLKDGESSDILKLMYRIRTGETWTTEKMEELTKFFANMGKVNNYQEC